MKKNILVICDPDERYLKRLDGFLRDSLSIAFDIVGFTKAASLKDFKQKEEALLIISQSLFKVNAVKGFKNILILDERPSQFAEDDVDFGMDEEAIVRHTIKFQSSEKIAESILAMCLEMPNLSASGIRKSLKNRMKIIGFYTPDRRIVQTGCALKLSEELGHREKLLFLCNDPYCIDKTLRGGEFDENLSDLMYYAQCEDERFAIYLEKIKKRKGSFEYLPLPGGQIRDCEGEDYIKLLRKIEESADIQILIADFSEPVKNLPEVLKMCDLLITLSDKGEGCEERIRLFKTDMEKVDGFDMSRLLVCTQSDMKSRVIDKLGDERRDHWTTRN